MTSIITELIHIFVLRPAKGRVRMVEFRAAMKTFRCCLFYSRVVVSLTHFLFPFSILIKHIDIVYRVCKSNVKLCVVLGCYNSVFYAILILLKYDMATHIFKLI